MSDQYNDPYALETQQTSKNNNDFMSSPNENHSGSGLSQTVSVKEWLITLLILLVPLVNIILFFVFAFSKDTPPSKANFFKAYLMIIGIVFLLSALFMAIS